MKILRAASAAVLLVFASPSFAGNVTLVAPDQVTPLGATPANPLFVGNGGSSGVGGVSSFSRIVTSAATTNATSAKASPGRVYKIFACNTTTTAKFVRFYNLATAPVVGTSPVFFSRPLPGAGAAGAFACTSYDVADIGWYFSAGIAYAITGASPDSDTTALAAGDVQQVSVEYQ